MKYKITSALKHIMLTITSYIHNCEVDILHFTLYNINRTVHMTRTTAHKELYSINNKKDTVGNPCMRGQDSDLKLWLKDRLNLWKDNCEELLNKENS